MPLMHRRHSLLCFASVLMGEEGTETLTWALGLSLESALLGAYHLREQAVLIIILGHTDNNDCFLENA